MLRDRSIGHWSPVFRRAASQRASLRFRVGHYSTHNQDHCRHHHAPLGMFSRPAAFSRPIIIHPYDLPSPAVVTQNPVDGLLVGSVVQTLDQSPDRRRPHSTVLAAGRVISTYGARRAHLWLHVLTRRGVRQTCVCPCLWSDSDRRDASQWHRAHPPESGKTSKQSRIVHLSPDHRLLPDAHSPVSH